MTRWSLFLQTPSLLHHFLGLYSVRLPPWASRAKAIIFPQTEHGLLIAHLQPRHLAPMIS